MIDHPYHDLECALRRASVAFSAKKISLLELRERLSSLAHLAQTEYLARLDNGGDPLEERNP